MFMTRFDQLVFILFVKLFDAFLAPNVMEYSKQMSSDETCEIIILTGEVYYTNILLT